MAIHGRAKIAAKKHLAYMFALCKNAKIVVSRATNLRFILQQIDSKLISLRHDEQRVSVSYTQL